MCGHCDSLDHDTRNCPAVARIQQSERHAELPDRNDTTAVDAWLDDQ